MIAAFAAGAMSAGLLLAAWFLRGRSCLRAAVAVVLTTLNKRWRMPFSRRARRIVSCAAAVTLLTSMVSVGIAVDAQKALAAGTVLFNQPFHDNTVDGTAGSVSLPTSPATGINTACLTAAGNATANPLASCPTATDPQGSGKLRLTSAANTQEGGVFATTSVPTSQGLDVTFNTYQYGGSSADGIAFVLAAVNPASPQIPTALGQSGGALGYSASNSTTNGLSYGYLGVGFDTYGNFSNKYEGSGCTDPANIAKQMPGQVVVRGPGNGTVGYCALQSSAATATSGPLALRAPTRAASVVPVEVVDNPSSSSVTTPSGLVVPAGDYDVHFTPVGGTAQNLIGALPVVPSGLYPASWVTASGFPKQLAFGWVASTGASTDFHEIDAVTVNSLNAVPQLAVSQTSYAAATLATGSPVTYSVTASSSGATENQPVTVTETLPAGVLPVGASGPGWVCAAPSGQQISCTSSVSPFTSGTFTVNGVVTSSSVTPAVVQSSTTAVASSSDGSPATSSSAPAGTVPAAPTVTGISPTNFAAGGGNDVKITGTGLSGATAIEIGTAAQFTAGTPTTLNLCSSSGPGCFTVTSSTALDISAMPAHAAGAVTVEVVTLGTSASTAYTYNTGPALLFPAPPSGEAGVSYSDQLTVTGGTSPFTWSVSAGSLPPGVTLNASTGLLSGIPATAGSYPFTVKVTDNSGASNTEAVTLTVIPGPSLNFPTPPSGWTNTVYRDTLTESGGTSPFAWSVSGGSLPAGISLSADGSLTGTPTATGTSSFTVKVTDANGQSATEATSLTVSAGVSATFPAPPGAVIGTAYTDTLTATGGTAPYTWSVNSGTLPPGIALSSAGVLSGTPTTAGTYAFSVNVVDANNGIATTSISLVVSPALPGAPTIGSVSAGDSAATVNWTAPASNGGGAITGYVVTPYIAGVAQAAQTFSSSATTESVTGLTAGASYTFKVAAVNAAGTGPLSAASAAVTVNAGPGLTFGAPPAGEVSVGYSDQLTASGGTGALTWSVSGGTLPGGLTLSSTGLLSGTPTAAGSFPVTITVTDPTGGAASKAVTLVIAAVPSLANAAPPAGQAGVAYSDALAVTGGTGPFTWAVSGGSLPAGLTLNASTGVLSGTPTTAGLSTFTVKVTDSYGLTATQSLNLTVAVGPLVIAASASASTVAQGATLGYTITITNTAASAYSGVTFSVPLSNVTDDAVYNGNAAATAGTVAVSGQTLTWTGGLAAGAAATITFSVTVGNPYTGNGTLAFTVTSPTTGTNCPANGTDPRCTVSVPVSALTITQAASAATAAPGAVVGYTITVTNSGLVAYSGATFTDPLAGVLGNAAYNGNAAATAGSVSYTSPNLTWTGSLAAGATATITFSVTVNSPDTGSKILASTITSGTSGANCFAGSTDARCTATVTVQGLTITSTANTASATPGATVQYTITVANSGQAAYTGASITDSLAGVLDDAVYNGDAAATAGSVSYTSPNLTWSGNLAAGATATITFSATVNNPDTGDKVLATAITSPTPASNCPASGPAPACGTSVTVLVPALTIVMSSGVSSTTPGSAVAYTVTVTNSGQTPYTGTSAVVSLAGVLDDAAYNNNAAATAGAVSYTSPNLTWTGTLAVGATATITYSVTVSNPDTGNHSLASSVTSAAAGSNCPSGGSDSRCSSAVAVLVPGLNVTVTANTASTTAGSVVQYTIVADNTGQTTDTGVLFTDALAGVLDDATYNGNAAATAGSVSFASPNLTWTGTLAPGATATITFSVTVNNPDTGDKILASTLTTTGAGSNCLSGSTDTDCFSTVTASQLTINNTANVATTTPGSVVRYTATFANTGQTAYTGITVASNITDVLDDATPNGDQTATSGTLTLTATGITWTGNIPVGGTVTVTGTVTVNNPDTGNKVMTSTLTTAAPGSNCPSGGTDPRCTATVNVLIPALTIVKTANVSTTTPGSVVGYTVTVTDTGQTPYTGATFSDSLSGLLPDAAYNGDAAATTGSVSYAAPVLTWTGNLAVGATATITYSVTVNNPDTGDKSLSNTVTSTTTGSNCPVGGSDPRCTATVQDLVPGLTLTVSANNASTTAGSVVQYTVTAVNTGQTTDTGVSFTDALAGVLDDATYNGNAAATVGSVSYASPTLTWTGTLAPGAGATVTFSVTVNNPDTGNKILSSAVTSAAAGSNCPSGGTAPACSSTVTVASLLIVDTASVPTTTPGSVVRYTSTFTNTGQSAYSGITISINTSDVLDDATPNGDQTATSGTLTVTGTAISWTGSIPVGGTVTVTGTVTVNNPDTGNKVMTSYLSTAAAGSNCPAGSTDPRCTATVNVLIPGLTIVKTANTSAAVPGQAVGYTVTITDSGQTPYTGAVVTDSLAGLANDAVYDGDAAATAGSVSYAAPVLTWTGSLVPGASATITYSVTVNNPDTGGKLLVNTVTSSAVGSTCPPGATGSPCQVTVPVLTPGLTIVKTASAASAVPGQAVTYTIAVTDSGQTPYTGAALTDSLAGVLGDAAYNGDAAATAGSVSYAAPNLTWTGNLAPGGSATITYSVTVDNPDTGGHLLANTVTSTTPGSNCPAGGADPRCSATVTVSQLTIVSTPSAGTATPGATVNETTTITNTGQTPYSGISVVFSTANTTAQLSDVGNETASSGTLSVGTTGAVWTGNVPVGATVTITGGILIGNPYPPGGQVIAITDATAAPGSNCPSGSTDPRCTMTVNVVIPGLTIVKTASTSAAVPGQVVGYTVTVTDSGQTPYSGAVVTDDLTGVLDDAVYDGDAAATAGSVGYAAPVLTWTGSLSPGGSATITYSVTVGSPDTGDHLLVNTVASSAAGSSCPPGTTSSPCQVIVPVLTPALTIVQTAATTSGSNAVVTPGGVVSYTITVTNTGQVPYTGAALTDPLGGVLDDAAYNGNAAATAGSVSYASPTLTWTGALAPGASATITYSVTVNNPDTGNQSLTGTVVSATPGSNCPAGGGDARCTVTVTVVGASTLTFTQTAAASSAVAGGTVAYTITIANSGASPYLGASFTDPLGGVLDDATWDGDAVASSGTVAFASPTLSWAGNVPANGAVTITYSVTVNNPDTGNGILTSTISSPSANSNCPAASPGPRCIATVTVSQLTIVSTPSAGTVTPGATVNETTTITNTGQTPYYGISVSFTTPNTAAQISDVGNETASSGTLSIGTGGAVWTGDVPVGATVTLSGSIIVANPWPAGGQVITLTAATTTPGSNCPSGSTDPRCTQTVNVVIPGLTIVKTANTSAAVPGQVVGYTVTVTDSGQTPYSGAVVTDDLTGILNDAVYNGDATATAGSVGYAAPVLTWTGSLAPGASATITYSVTVNNPDTGGKLLVNTVSSSAVGSTCPPGATGSPCQVTIPVLTPGLTIVKTASTATAVPGQAVTYTIAVTDSGQTPYAGAALTDSLAGVLGDAAYNNDAAATVGSVSYAAPVLAWTGDLAPGATATITYSVTVSNPDTGGHVLANTVTSTTPGTNCGPGSTDPQCTATVTVAQLTIVSTPSAGTATPGATVNETTTITNTGQTPYQGISVDFTTANTAAQISDAGNETASSGTLSVGTTGAVWTGDVPVGGAVTITGSIIVANPYPPGGQVIAITDSSAAPGSNCPAGSADPRCTMTVNVVIPGLTIVKTANVATTTPGSVVGYTVTVTDSGQTPYSGAVVTDDLTGVLDDAVYNGDAAATAGAVSYTAPVLTWTGSLSPGASATITYSVTVDNPDTGGKVLINTVASSAAGSTCPPGTTSSPCQVTVPVLTPALTIVKTASTATAAPGQTVTYTITVTDSGQTPYTGATLTDPLAGVLDDAAYNNDATATVGSVSYAAPNLTWTGNLTPGASATITYSVTVNNPDTGNGILAGTITSPTAGSTCPVGNLRPRCTATVYISELTIVNTASTSVTTPDGVVGYTITATNSGQTTLTGATLTASFVPALDDAAYNGDATATTGTVTLAPAGSSLTWTGNLAVGASVTITFSVTVDNPDTGNKILTNTVASATPGSTCPSGSANPACTAVTTVLIPGLAIANTASTSTPVPGSVVGYTLTITDTGQTAYTGATVTDTITPMLDDAAYDGDATATAGAVSYASGVLTWTGTLAPGAAAVVTFSVTVDNPDTGDKLLIATASSAVPGSTCPPGTTSPPCRSTVGILTPALTIVSTANTSSTVPGATVGYTITITDTGQTPYSGATVADSLAGLLDDAAYDNDAAASTGSVSYASPTLTWTGSLAPGDAATITFSATVSNPDTGDQILSTTATSTATGNNCPSGSTDPDCVTSIPVSVLTITNTASVSTTTPGSTVSYTVTVSNAGRVDLTDINFTLPLSDVLDDATYNGNATATEGQVSFAGSELTFDGDLDQGQSAVIRFTVTVDNPDTGNKTLADTVTSTTPGSTCPASGPAPAACTTVVTVLVPGLTITTTASSDTTTPGSVVGYTIAVTNTGQTPYTPATVTDDLANVLNDSAYNGDAAATSGSVAYGGHILTWTGNLAPGDTATITYSITINNPDNGDKHLVTTAVSADPGSSCPAGSANPACTAIVTDLIPALTIIKTANVASAAPGTPVDYTITVADTGQTPYAGATVTDDLTGVLGAAAYNGDAAATTGTVAYASPTLTWTGDLAPGDTATITYSVTVDNPETGGTSLVNTATSAAAGSTCPPGTSSGQCTVTTGVISGPLTMTAPATAALGSGPPGATITSSLGTVGVTDGRGFGADWAASVSASDFTTGAGGPAQTIPAGDALYDITGLTTATGPATFGYTPQVNLSANPQDIVNAANVAGNTAVTWNPVISVTVPGGAIGGTYTGTIVHSVS